MLNSIRRRLKSALLQRWHIPYSPIPGMTPSIYKRFRNSQPISLIDIGAHHGDFTLSMRRLCTIEQAVLVEPIENLAERLRRHPHLRGYSVYDCAASDFDGEIEMKIFPNAPHISSALQLDSSFVDVIPNATSDPITIRRPALTLDSILSRANFFGTIDLIKIDVQGLEHSVIKGATEALSRTKCVFTEVSFRPIYIDSSVFDDIYRMMYEHGFGLTALEPGFKTQSGELLQAEALFVKGATHSFDG